MARFGQIWLFLAKYGFSTRQDFQIRRGGRGPAATDPPAYFSRDVVRRCTHPFLYSSFPEIRRSRVSADTCRIQYLGFPVLGLFSNWGSQLRSTFPRQVRLTNQSTRHEFQTRRGLGIFANRAQIDREHKKLNENRKKEYSAFGDSERVGTGTPRLRAESERSNPNENRKKEPHTYMRIVRNNCIFRLYSALDRNGNGITEQRIGTTEHIFCKKGIALYDVSSDRETRDVVQT